VRVRRGAGGGVRPMVKLEHPTHGPFYVDASQVAMVRQHGPEGDLVTVIYLKNTNNGTSEVLGTVHEVMDKLGLKHE